MNKPEFKIERWKRSRYFAIYSPGGQLIAITTYKRGAANIARIFQIISKFVNLSEALFDESISA